MKRVILAAMLVLVCSGCAAWRKEHTEAPDIEAAVARARETTKVMVGAVVRLDKNARGARDTATEIGIALQKSAVEGRAALPEPAPQPLVGLCDHLELQAGRLERFVGLPLDQCVEDAALLKNAAEKLETEALRPIEAVQGDVNAIAKERDAWKAEAEKQKKRADDAIYRMLLWTIAGSFFGIIGGVAVALWLHPKLGAALATLSGLIFAASTALYRWLDIIQWIGLGLLVATFVGILVALWKYRKALKEVVTGNEAVKKVSAAVKAVFKASQTKAPS